MKKTNLPLSFLYHSFILPLKDFRPKSRLLRLSLLFLSIILLGAFVLKLTMVDPTSAAWYNDNWSYRTKITFGNTGAADSSKKVKFDIDTATLITAGKMQSDCGDSRFTDANGIILQYYLDSAGGACNGASTDYYVLVPTIGVGTTTLYHYYGNPSVENGTNTSQFTESTFSPNSGPTISATEENSPAPALYLKLDEAQGTMTYDSSINKLNGTLGTGSSAPTWKTRDECFVNGCLDFESNDYASVSDNAAIDLGNIGTVQAWVRSDDVSSSENNFAAWTTVTAPDGAANGNLSTVDMTIVGNKAYFASYLHNGATETFQTASINLDGTSFSGWTSQTAPDGAGGGETTSVAIDSDGLKLYYGAFTHANTTEAFYTASSNLDGTGFSSWTTQTAPDGAGQSDFNTIDMVVVDGKMYFAAFLHSGTTEAFYTAGSNLDGTSFTGWISQSAPDGVGDDDSASVAIDSDGVKLYYSAFGNTNATEVFFTSYSNLDGTGFASWTSQSAPDGAADSAGSSVDMVIVGGKTYYAVFAMSGTTETFTTMNSNLDGTSMASAVRTAPDGAGATGTASVSMGTDGKKLYYLAFTHNDVTEALSFTSSDITSHPVIAKTDAYELIQTGRGFVFDWAGSPKSFGSITASDWNHVAITQDGTTMKYFVNGKLVRSQAVTTDFTSNSSTLYVGSDLTRFFNGKIDEVKVYPYARSEAEIKQDYASRGSVHGVSAQLGGSDILSKLQQGLIGWWKMDENTGTSASDSSGSGYTGTLGTGSSAPTWSGGKFGSGLDLDGSNDYVQVSNPTLPTNDFTYAAWVYFDSLSDERIFMAGDGAGNNEIDIEVGSHGSGIVSVEVNGTGDQLISTSTVSTGVWTHLVTTRSGSTIRLYMNGVQDASTGSDATTLNFGSCALLMGVDADSGCTGSLGNYLDGKIDEARMYNRALSPSEVSALYNFAPGPVGYWDLNENSGTATVYDRSGNGLNGTLFGSITQRTWVPGKFGSTLNFDGTDDEVRVNDADILDIADAVTLEAWVKFDTTPSGSAGVVRKDGSYRLYVNNQGKAAGESHLCTGVSSNTVLSPNTWYHLVWSYDESINKLYVNGILDNTSTESCALPVGTGNLQIARHDAYFDGLIDEVRVYNYIRSSSQIIEDMNGGHPLGGSPVGSQVAYWKMDNIGIGTSAFDQSINANTLTASSNSWTQSGKFGSAWNGTGSNWLSRADDSDLDIGGSEPFSLSMWAKSDSASNPGANEFLMTKQAATNNPGYRMYFNTSGQVVCDIDDDTSSYPEDSATTTTDYYDNLWHNIICIRDIALDKLTVYVDANQAAQDTDVSAIGDLSNSSTFYVGDDDGDATNSFAGDIDEVKVYRAALTDPQVKTELNQGQSIVLGSLSTGVGGTAPSWSQDRSYCVPGDTSTCSPPVGEWKLDELSGARNDTSSNGNNLTDKNTVTSSQGKYGNAANFENIPVDNGQSLQITDGSQTSLDITGPITVEGWINTESTDGTINLLASKGVSSGQLGYSLGTSASGKIRFSLSNDGTATTVLNGGTTILTGVWYHYAAVYNGSNMYVYLNGVSDATPTAYSSGIFDNTNSFCIGAGGVTCSASTNDALIDDVKVYNYARTPAQIAWEYNRGAPIAWLKFDECQGTRVNDWGPNANGGFMGNNGTLSIGATGTNDSPGTCNSGDSSEAWANGATGKRNASISVDGTDDYIQVSDTSSLRFDASTQDFSLFAWVKRSANGVGYVISKEDADNDGWRLQFDSGNTVTCSEDSTDVTSTSTITDTNWHFVGCTISRAGNGQVYIDGKPSGSAVSMGSDAMATTANITLGTRSYSAANYLTGQIDDVRIFNYALTQQQINTVMNNGAVSFR